MYKYEDMFNPSFLKKPDDGIPAPLPKDATVTMAYVPFQQQPVLYDDTMTGFNAGISEGTMFPELNKPFLGKGAEK